MESVVGRKDSKENAQRWRNIADPLAPAIPVEQYRSLALSLERVEPRDTHRVLVVTSALPSEGKTLTVANLALTLSSSYRRRVLVVDGDLRRPRLFDMFATEGLDTSVAENDLPESLKGFARVQRVGPSLSAAGFVDVPYRDPINTLNAPALTQLFDWARTRFEWVLVDSPPVALVPDASLLARSADGVLLVVQAAVTPYEAASLAVSQLGRERLLGVVMNRVPKNSPDGSFRYYEDYGDYYGYRDAIK